MNSDDFFKIYRRFNFLRGRLLLDREIELARLEERLIKMDRKNADISNTSVMTRDDNGYSDAVSYKDFRDLMGLIDKKLKIYGGKITLYSSVNPADRRLR